MSDTQPPTALAEPDAHQELVPVAPQHPAVNSYTVSQLVTLSKLVSDALTLPKALQGKPADVLAVMLAGRELGIGPMQSTRQVHIISGQTALASELKLALAKRAGHDIRPVDRGPRHVAVQCLSCSSHVIEWALSRTDAKSPSAVIADEIIIETWEGESGRRQKVMAPLVDKTNYQSWGFAMLWARAVGQLCREHCPEAVGGLYSAEELS